MLTARILSPEIEICRAAPLCAQSVCAQSADPDTHAVEMSVKEGADQKPASTDGKSAGGICSKCHCGLSWMGWASLIIFMVQNAIGGMLVRYPKAFVEAEYSSEVGVLIQELVFKLPISLVFYIEFSSDQFKSKDSSPFNGPRVTGVDTSSISIKMNDIIISLGT